jgi:hypothetical protein
LKSNFEIRKTAVQYARSFYIASSMAFLALASAYPQHGKLLATISYTGVAFGCSIPGVLVAGLIGILREEFKLPLEWGEYSFFAALVEPTLSVVVGHACTQTGVDIEWYLAVNLGFMILAGVLAVIFRAAGKTIQYVRAYSVICSQVYL